jgi:membrane protein required for colicin V production
VNVADWIIVLVVLLSIVHAASSGFFQEAFGIAGLVFGYLVAAWGYRSLADHFGSSVSSQWLGQIAAFLVIFLSVMIVAGILGRIVRWMMKEAGLRAVDRVLGGGLWFADVCWWRLFW